MSEDTDDLTEAGPSTLADAKHALRIRALEYLARGEIPPARSASEAEHLRMTFQQLADLYALMSFG